LSPVVLNGEGFAEPSTKVAAGLLDGLNTGRPVLLVASADEEAVHKSFRNLERVGVTTPGELEVRALAWASVVVMTTAALGEIERIAS
jgi:ribosomal protein L4